MADSVTIKRQVDIGNLVIFGFYHSFRRIILQSNRLNEIYRQLWHGADYNYEQWLDAPEVLQEDFRLMKLANCTAMSVGIFSWAMLEPAEGQYDFGWLDNLMDELHANGIKAVLATPSAAHPAWLSKKYPEVLRMNVHGKRGPHRGRQNFCFSSPVFRKKCLDINTQLALRYAGHPALLLWHVSNEYGSTPCHCPACYVGFREWLRARYGTLEALNKAWWATFWSHRVSDWDEIEPVDLSVHGLMLDWMRFNSDLVLDFYQAEIAPLRKYTPDTPVTTNFMRPDVGLNYWKFAEHVDLISWDSYPEWHVKNDVETAAQTAFFHDLHRGYKGQPFYLIESSPSQTNWQPLSRLKRPGVVELASLQALAHGALGVNYFQWRQSRGGEEKFHGAVVSHREGESSRVFQGVMAVGNLLEALPELATAHNSAKVGVIYDYENGWALNFAQMPRNAGEDYQPTVIQHYTHFWQRGIPVDILSPSGNFEKYKLIIAPMLYLLSERTAQKLAEFVANGGTLVTTYLTGMVNESDLCYLDGYPKPLGEVLGIFLNEFDTFGPSQAGKVAVVPGNVLGLTSPSRCDQYAELVEPTGAEVLAVYASEFYKGKPAITAHAYGQGRAYHLATRLAEPSLGEFYQKLTGSLNIDPVFSGSVPYGVSVQCRETDTMKYLFFMNFTEARQTIELAGEGWLDPFTGKQPDPVHVLQPYGRAVFRSHCPGEDQEHAE